MWILPSSGLLHGVRWFETDVSGLRIGPIFKVKLPKKKLTLEYGTDSPETSVSRNLMPRNNPEDGTVQLNCGGSLRSCTDRRFSKPLLNFCQTVRCHIIIRTPPLSKCSETAGCIRARLFPLGVSECVVFLLSIAFTGFDCFFAAVV